MKLIFCRWNSICETGITNSLEAMNLDVTYIDDTIVSFDYDKDYLKRLSDTLMSGTFDAVLSVNFIPIISRVCNIFHIPYLCIVVDSPSFTLYSNTIANAVNHIFIFDKQLYNKFIPKNPTGIYHIPLGCDLDTWNNTLLTPTDHKDYDCDVSFIGSLYSEKNRFNGIENMPEYIKGYSMGIIDAQLKVIGQNFIEDSMTDEFTKEFKKCADWFPLGKDYEEDDKAIIADTYIGYKCTELDRIRTLNALGCTASVDLYTLSDTSPLTNINCRGGADSVTMMPKIFKCSKINLNMTSRPIKSGISLRVFDILGAGGFLLSNYQEEIPDYFTIGKDLEVYYSTEDLIEKTAYYLEHDNQRQAIAKQGYNTVANKYTYTHMLNRMFNMALGLSLDTYGGE